MLKHVTAIKGKSENDVWKLLITAFCRFDTSLCYTVYLMRSAHSSCLSLAFLPQLSLCFFSLYLNPPISCCLISSAFYSFIKIILMLVILRLNDIIFCSVYLVSIFILPDHSFFFLSFVLCFWLYLKSFSVFNKMLWLSAVISAKHAFHF